MVTRDELCGAAFLLSWQAYIHTYMYTYMQTEEVIDLAAYIKQEGQQAYIHTCIHTYMYTYMPTEEVIDLAAYIKQEGQRLSDRLEAYTTSMGVDEGDAEEMKAMLVAVTRSMGRRYSQVCMCVCVCVCVCVWELMRAMLRK